MKNIFYVFAIIIGFTFTACDPMEDIYNDLEETGALTQVIKGDATFTMSDDDYEDLDLNYGNFNSVEEAKSAIPALLSSKFPVWGKESSAVVTFKIYYRINTYSAEVYALTDAEHNEITGSTYGNFDRDYHIFNYLEAQYPTPEEDDFVSLRYNYYAGSETTLTDGFYFDGTDWNRVAGFKPAEYTAMGEGFANFTDHDEAEAKTPIALLDVYKFEPKNAGDIVSTMYELYKGGGVTKSYTANYVYNGSSWSKYENEALETIQFGHDGTTWVPDNTIKYSLVAADYVTIADALAASYPDPTTSAGNYGNFDRRVGNQNYWSEEMLAEGMAVLLNNVDPNAAEGQKYIMTFAIYNGSAGFESINVIKTNGEWVLN